MKRRDRRALRRSCGSEVTGLPTDRAITRSIEQVNETESIARGSRLRDPRAKKRTDLVEDELSGHPEEVGEVRASGVAVARGPATVGLR